MSGITASAPVTSGSFPSWKWAKKNWGKILAVLTIITITVISLAVAGVFNGTAAGTDQTVVPEVTAKATRLLAVAKAIEAAKTEKASGKSNADIVAAAVAAVQVAKAAAAAAAVAGAGTAAAAAAAEAVLTAEAIETAVKEEFSVTTPPPPPPLKTVKGYYPNGAISLPKSANATGKNSKEACKSWAKGEGYAAWTYNKTKNECSGFTKVNEKFPGNKNDEDNVTGCTFSNDSPADLICPAATSTIAVDTTIVAGSANFGFWRGHEGIETQALKNQFSTVANSSEECREWAGKAGYAGWVWHKKSYPIVAVREKCDGVRYVFQKFTKKDENGDNDYSEHTYAGCTQTYKNPSDVICPAVGGTVQYKVGTYSYSYGYSYRIHRSHTLGGGWTPSSDFHVYSYPYPGTTAYTVSTTNDQTRCLVLKGENQQYGVKGPSGWGEGADGQGYTVFYAWDDRAKAPQKAVAFSVGFASGTNTDRSAVVLGTDVAAAGSGWTYQFTFYAFKDSKDGY